MLLKNKYDLISIIIVVATLIVLGVGALMFGSFGHTFGVDLQDSVNDLVVDGSISSDNGNYSTDFIANDSQNFSDNYFFWFLIAVFIGIIMMGLYLEFEPATMIIIFIVGTIVVAMAWLGSGIYSDFAEDIDDSSNMSKTNVLLNSNYFPIFIFICLVVLIVIMYNRKKAGDYQ